MTDFYNPFSFGGSEPKYPTIQAGYYSNTPFQPGTYGENRFGLGYTSNQSQIAPPNIPQSVQPQAQQQANGMSGQQVNNLISGIGRGVAAGAAMLPSASDDFSIDPFAGYKGSVAGGGMGVAGAAGAIIGGITSQVGNFSRINRNLNNVDTSVQGYEIGPDGRPVYGGQNIQAANQTLDSINKGYNKLGGSNLLSPELLADPANTLFSTVFGTKKRLRRKRDELKRGIHAAQSSYNTAAEDFSRKRQTEAAFRKSQFEMFNNSINLPTPYSSYF